MFKPSSRHKFNSSIPHTAGPERKPPRLGWQRALAGLFLLFAASVFWGSAARAQDDFLDPEKAFVFSAVMANPGTVEVQFKVAPGYYLYRERMSFEALPPGSATLGTATFPKGDEKYDPTFDKRMEVYHHDMAVSLPVAGKRAFTLKVTSQGCAEAGICYPPIEHTIALVPAAGGYALAGGGIPSAEGTAGGDSNGSWHTLFQSGDIGLADALGGLGWIKTAAVFLVLGLLLAFTPCVLPMVPIVATIVVGDRSGSAASRWRGLGLAAAYVAGMSVVYTALGIAAGLSGAGLAAWLQAPWVLSIFALLLAILALAMFDVFTLQLPGSMQASLSARSAAIPGGRVTGAVIMGALSALIVGPCVAAPLAGALLYISQTGDVVLGGSALFALAWGMGIPVLLVGASAGALLPRAGAWMAGVKYVFGLLLLATAWWMLLPVVAPWVSMLGWAFLCLLSAVMLRAFEALPQPFTASRLFGKAFGLLMALGGILIAIGAASGAQDPLQPLAHWRSAQQRADQGGSAALQSNGPQAGLTFTAVRTSDELSRVLAASTRPVMLDFYADWCVSCHEMERFTFRDGAVRARMAKMQLVRADVTANNPDDRALLKRFRLFGPPGMIFFAAGGAEMADARVVGFKNAADFSAVLDRALAGGN